MKVKQADVFYGCYILADCNESVHMKKQVLFPKRDKQSKTTLVVFLSFLLLLCLSKYFVNFVFKDAM